MDKNNRIEEQKLAYLVSLVAPRNTFVMFEVLYNVVMIILSWISLPVEVFVRKDFGEQYLSLTKIWIAWMTLGTFTFLYSLYAVMAGNPMAFWAYSGMMRSMWNTGASGLAYHLFYYSFLALVIYHRWRIWRRNKAGVAWLSTSFGTSHFAALKWDWIGRVPYIGSLLTSLVTVDDFVLLRFVEPATVYLAGRLLWHIDGLLGTFIVVSAVALLVKNQLAYSELRSRVLAMGDAMIVSNYLAEAMAGRPKELTAGFSVVNVPSTVFLDSQPLDLTTTLQETLGTL